MIYRQGRSFTSRRNRSIFTYSYLSIRELLEKCKVLLPCQYIGVTIPESFAKIVVGEVVEKKYSCISDEKIGYFVPLFVPLFYFERDNDSWIRWFDEV